MDGKKPFGLILPKKTKVPPAKISNVFDDDSEDDSKGKKIYPKIPQSKIPSKKHVSVEQSEDPSIYEYDSIYDDMKAKQVQESKGKEKKSSRYIDTLLKAADKRKKQYERRVEKKIQNEREKEGDKFKDKDAFVTTAYKKKMQEMEDEEERERRENELNEMMDVTKQKDLSGFYRHFLKQAVGEENIPVFGDRNAIKKEVLSEQKEIKKDVLKESKEIKKDVLKEPKEIKKEVLSESECEPILSVAKGGLVHDKVSAEPSTENLDCDSDSVSSGEDSESPPESSNVKQRGKKVRKKHDSDIDILSSSSDCSESAVKRKDQMSRDSETHTVNDEIKVHRNFKKRKVSADLTTHNTDSSDKEIEGSKILMNKEQADSLVTSKELKNDSDNEYKRQKKLQNIFLKRTIGAVFEEAQARYFQRLAARSAAN